MQGDDSGRFDTIVQSAMVALFHSNGVGLAPMAPMTRSGAALQLSAPLGSIQFRTPRGGGTFLLSVPTNLFSREGAVAELGQDRVRELLNQFMGSIKIRLAQFQLSATCGLPSVLTPLEIARSVRAANALRVYAFRSLKGDVQLVLDGKVDDATLVYSGKVEVRREGEIILFDGNVDPPGELQQERTSVRKKQEAR